MRKIRPPNWYDEYWQADIKIVDSKAIQLTNNFSFKSEISSSGFSSKIRQEFIDTTSVKELKEKYRHLARSYGVKI